MGKRSGKRRKRRSRFNVVTPIKEVSYAGGNTWIGDFGGVRKGRLGDVQVPHRTIGGIGEIATLRKRTRRSNS